MNLFGKLRRERCALSMLFMYTHPANRQRDQFIKFFVVCSGSGKDAILVDYTQKTSSGSPMSVLVFTAPTWTLFNSAMLR